MKTKHILNAGDRINDETRVIFGPYGTLIESLIPVALNRLACLSYGVAYSALSSVARSDIARVLQLNLDDLSAGAILRNPGLGLVESSIARYYCDAIRCGGSQVLASANTFRERGLLLAVNLDDKPFLEAVGLHLIALRDGLSASICEGSLMAAFFGPKGDCYSLDGAPATVSEARDFHEHQVRAVSEHGLAIDWHETVPSTNEAIGIVLAAKMLKKPCVVNLNVDANGNMRDGNSLKDALCAIDCATDSYAIGFGLNCCPIEIIDPVLQSCEDIANRIVSIYPNASSIAPENFHEDDGVVHGLKNPWATAQYLAYLVRKYNLKFIGGCCGYTPSDVGLISFAVKQELFNTMVPTTDAFCGDENHKIAA